MKVFFEEIWQTITSEKKAIESSLVPEIAVSVSNFLQSLALDLSKWDKVTELALRYFTFEGMELKHTCCRMLLKGCEWSEEEIMEIEDEYREKLDLLELLLQYFQVADRSFESQGGQGDKFTSFLITERSPRVHHELANIETIQLTAYEKSKAE
ncbi:hypothetical protein F4803DRAFT_97965 [Xylaria telfairii]|nr:hypothetical protein F4803DRAFT_97965 [Xylaria telfairii]